MNPAHSPLKRKSFAISLMVASISVSISAHAAVVFTAGFQPSSSLPLSYFAESDAFSDPTTSTGGRQLFARASNTELVARVGVKGALVENFMVGISVDDIVFTSSDPTRTSTLVTMRAVFSGEASGGPDINYSPNARLRFNGGLDAAVMGTPDPTINELLSVTSEVRLNSPVTMAADMEMRIFAPRFQFGFLDFSDSLDFIVDEVFLLEDGISVSAPSWGLSNNQLSAVPVPGMGIVFGLATVLLGVMGRSRTKLSREM